MYLLGETKINQSKTQIRNEFIEHKQLYGLNAYNSR